MPRVITFSFTIDKADIITQFGGVFDNSKIYRKRVLCSICVEGGKDKCESMRPYRIQPVPESMNIVKVAIKQWKKYVY